MRRAFRLIGGIRFVVGATIVANSFLFQSQLGEVWATLLVLLGAIVGISGLVGVFLIFAYYILFPIAFLGAFWLIFDSWNDVSFLDAMEKKAGLIKFHWIVGLFGTPLTIWQLNQSWFFMVNNFGIDGKPDDTPHRELFATGLIQVTDSSYAGAVSVTEQGLILDRRNFSPVILPWKWITSVDPKGGSASPHPTARVRMRNDEDQFITLSIPWNEELLHMNTARLRPGNV